LVQQTVTGIVGVAVPVDIPPFGAQAPLAVGAVVISA
jgi:hypothetical protein